MTNMLLYLIYGMAATRFYQIIEDIRRETTEQISPVTSFVIGLTIFTVQGMIGYVIVLLFKLITE